MVNTITPDASDLQLIPTVPVAQQRLLDLFDAAEALGYSMLCLFEASTPGATDALMLWAVSRDLAVEVRTCTPPGAPAISITSVKSHRGGGKLGAHIDIHGPARGEVVS